MADDRFDRDRLVTSAMEATGVSDASLLGDDSWQEGLDRLLDDLQHEARLSELGTEIVLGELAGYLATRLRVHQWRRDHPAVAAGPIEKPIVIVGQPRTGTTILYDLLAQDPQLRAPLTWEVDSPVPPPDPATYDVDPRIAESQATLAMVDLVLPGFTDFHPLGAQLAQECVRITGGDFKSMIFPTQYRVPSYNQWLLHEADLGSAYRYHHEFLQHLQANQAPQSWLLKSPAHLWHLDALVGEYPDVTVIQTHRDPLKVIASVSALVAHLRQLASDDTSVADAASTYGDDILLGLERCLAARDAGTIAPEREIDVHFTEFVADPLGIIKGIYDRLDRELTPDAEARMRHFLDTHPGDGGGGGTRYAWANTGLDAGEIRERARPYQERFDVVSEPVR